MEANELRIGNLVLLHCKNEKDEIAKLLTIDEIDGCYYNRASNKRYINKKYDKVQNGWCKFNIIQPILLTEEWFMRLPNGFVYPRWIKYVHELQNWYYWNNEKKELTFKELK